MTDFGGSLKKSEVFDFALLGVPFDEKSSFQKGAARGPEAIRRASTGEAINAWTELGVDLETEAVVVDRGDVDTSGSFPEVFRRIEKQVGDLLEKGTVPVVLGGDHSITVPVIRAFARKFRCLDILHFDAHPDLYEELYGDPYSHACPFARILEEGLVENLVQVGIRAATGRHRELAARNKVQMVEMKDFEGLADLRFRNPLYISLDMDALDPAFAPGVAHHEPGGLSTRQVIRTIHSLEACIVGLDVVEVNPDRDPAGITAAAAVKIIMECMGKIVFDKKKK